MYIVIAYLIAYLIKELWQLPLPGVRVRALIASEY